MITKESKLKMGWKRDKMLSAYFKPCEVCGKEFKTTPTSSKQFCCSRECGYKRKTKNRIKYSCLTCLNDIYALKRKSGGRKYCSTSCKIKALAKLTVERFEGKRIYGQWADSKAQKQWFLKTIGMCQTCQYDKIPEILEVHHIDRNRKNNRFENLTLICPNCHSEEHFRRKDGQFKNNLGLKIYAIN